MKRPTPQLRYRLMKAAKRELWKRRERFGYGEWFSDVVRSQNRLYPSSAPHTAPTPRVLRRLQGHLTLTADPEHSIRKIHQISDLYRIPPGTRVRVEMDDLESIDAPALLYLCSQITSLARLTRARIGGSFPRHEAARRALDDANFIGFMTGGEVRRRRRPGAHLELLEGVDLTIHTNVALRIQSFLEETNPTLEQIELDHIYLAVVECLENVGSHAYGPEWQSSGQRNWFVVGLYDETSRTTSVAILDRGVGIVRSVTSQMSRLRRVISPDADLLEDATLGRITESRDPKHGKGLRTLREFAVNRDGRRFHVLSSSRMITWTKSDGPIRRRLPHFEGTIVCLEISNPMGPPP